jgi:hypothetical protein
MIKFVFSKVPRTPLQGSDNKKISPSPLQDLEMKIFFRRFQRSYKCCSIKDQVLIVLDRKLFDMMKLFYQFMSNS